MIKGGARVSEDFYYGAPKLLIMAVCLAVCFPLLHVLGSKMGIFPYLIAPGEKNKKKSQWE